MFDDATIASMYVIKTHYVVRVMDVHPETQTVDVMQDQLNYVGVPAGDYVVTNEFGLDINAEVERPFILYDIPIQQLRWGQFEIQCMPAVGDTGYIEVLTDDISSWKEFGSAAFPSSGKKFRLESAIFVPFVANRQNLSQNFPDNTKLVIKSENLKIELTDDDNNQKIDVTGDLNITGDVSITGDTTVTGNIDMDGDLTVDGDVTVSNGDVMADGVSLKNHTHTFNYIGAGQGSSPQQGTTDEPGA